MRLGMVTLSPGIDVLIRQIQPEDKGLLTQGFGQLSTQSRYQRFFSSIESLTERDLKYLTEIDHVNHEALIAIDPDSGDLIAVARYVRLEPEESTDIVAAEVAVIVIDEWQGKGLGSILLERLVERARAAGIEQFLALVLSSNDDARHLFENLLPGQSKTRTGDPGQVEIEIALPEHGRFSDSRLAQIFRSTARGNLKFAPNRWLRGRVGKGRAG